MAFVQKFDHDRIMARCVHDDLTLQRDGIHMDDVMTGHFSRRAIDHHPFENAIAPKDQIDHPREVHDLRTAPVGSGNQGAGGMWGIDHIHALTFVDLFAGHSDFFKDFLAGAQIVALFIK